MEKAVYSRVLVSAERIEAAVEDLARRIEAACDGASPLLAVVVLEGARRFAANLLGRLRIESEARCIRASSYHGATQSSGQVEVCDMERLCSEAAGRTVLVIDDIYDTGLTLAAILEKLKQAGAEDVKTCVLLAKKTTHRRKIAVDFVGMEIEDAFVIGYGLDYEGKYRDLPFIAVLSDELIESKYQK